MRIDLDELFDVDEEYEKIIKEEMDLEREKYCNWIYNKKSYTPAIALEIVSNVKPGIYKLDNDFNMIPQNMVSDDLYIFPDSEIDYLLNEINKFWNRANKFKEANLIHKRGILLEGPPGTGKSSVITLLLKEVIEKYNGVVFLVNNMSDFVKTNEFLKTSFRRIEPDTFVITVIEDIDKLYNNHVEAEILDFFDGKSSIDHHLIISTSNDTSNLSDALLRPSRIDKKIYIDYPSEETRKIFFTKKGVTNNDLDKFIQNSEELTFSELKELFIGTYVMGNDFEDTLSQINFPYEKKEHSLKKDQKLAISI